MKILNINSYYYSSTVHKQLKDNLIGDSVCSFTYVPTYYGYKARPECNYPVEENVYKDECFKKRDRLSFKIKHKKILKSMIYKVNVKDYDITHAHSLFSNGYLSLKMKEKFDIPYMVTVRDTDVNVFFKKMKHLRKIGKEILLNASYIIFLSSSYRDNVIDKYVDLKNRKEVLDKTYVISNGIDEFWIENKLEENKKSSNSINLLHVGAINKRKNITNTLKASEILIKKGYVVNLTAVGKIKNKKIYDNFKNKKFTKYIDQLDKENLLDVYRQNDILVVPSITETFGLVYPEAMTQGLPVIYTKNQGFDGQFPEGDVGYSVEWNNPEQIASSILKITNNFDEISSSCVKNSNLFRWQDIKNKYLELYKYMLN